MGTFPPEDIKELVSHIAEILRSNGHTLAVSEAACGGLISAYLVSVPGASDFYIGGKLLYLLKQRLRLSGWSEDEITTYTGPSELVALKLARTTRYELGATYVISETGYAGPTSNLHLLNETDEDKVGRVYLGFNGPSKEVSCSKFTDSHDREKNMEQFARSGLEFLLDQLKSIYLTT